jgi:cell division protein FtsI/penicillin-binding protein 2
VIAQEPVQEGDDLYLTLDHRLQAEAERIARVTRANWGAKAVTIVAYDPATGGVLAMASEPGFDANEPPDPSTGRLKNRAVTDLYEPGSTYKVVTVAAALEERVARPSSRYVLAPEIQVGDKIIREAHARPAVTYSLREIVAQSSNVGVATIARNLGRRRLADWVERFGFGAKTGIDFPGESPGLVLPLDDWSDSTIGTVPIGQGIGVTSVQMVALYGTIANGGVWVQPHLVDRIEGAGARVFQPRKRRVVSARTARELSRMLEGVVTRGTATTAAIPGYSVAGKTGTALVPKPGGYWKGRYIASFVGFLPARKPRLVILVKVDEPKSGFYGGTVAAPAFAEFGRFAARYLEIPPDRPLSGSA